MISLSINEILNEVPGSKVYFLVLAFLFGMCMGSFLNCAAWRIVHGESVMKGRSHCAVCNHPLGLADLVPLFSYIFLHGKCRYCGEKIAARYLIAEIVSGAVFLSIVWKFGLSLATLQWLVLGSVLLCISFADLEDYLVPDRLIVIGIVTRLVFAPFLSQEVWWKTYINVLIGGLAVALPLLIFVIIADKVMGRETMGGGDIKIIFMVGLYFRWQESLLIMIMACIIGMIFAVIGKKIMIQKDLKELQEKQQMEEVGETVETEELSDSEVLMRGGLIPFGPSIACAAWIALFVAQTVVNWYSGLFS